MINEAGTGGSSGPSFDNGNQPKSPERRELLIDMAKGALVGFLVGNRLPRIDEIGTKKQEQIAPREASIIKEILDRSVNKSSEPEFWKKLEQRLTADQGKYLDIHSDNTGETISNNRHTYWYYADGKKQGQPNMSLVVIDPDGVKFTSRSILITLQLGQHGTVSEPNKYPHTQVMPLSDKELQQKFSHYFKEPEGANQTSWEVDRDNRQKRFLIDEASGLDYLEQISSIGELSFFISYPRTPSLNSPSVVPDNTPVLPKDIKPTSI